jgi:hypothetical protein
MPLEVVQLVAAYWEHAQGCDSSEVHTPLRGHRSRRRVSVRFSEAINDRFFIERTIAGSIALSAPVAMLNDDFRWLVVPGLEPGFRRDRLEFTTDASGLKIQFRVINVQTHAAPPWPAVRWEMTHTEEVQGETNFFSDYHCRLEGAPNSDRKLLISRAMQ